MVDCLRPKLNIDQASSPETSAIFSLNSLKMYNSDNPKGTTKDNEADMSIEYHDVSFTLGTSDLKDHVIPTVQIKYTGTDIEDENGESGSDVNDEDREDAGFHSSASADSLYARRRKSREKLQQISTSNSNGKEASGSQSPPSVQYNIFLNTKFNTLEPPLTPSVADVVQLKYNLSPEIIKEKTENEFNFVIPLPKSKSSTAESAASDELKNSITPLKYHLSTICTIGKGSFGRVYLTRHRETGRYYALKSMHIPAIINKRQVEHVHHEKQILQQLKHPFIVKLYDTAKDRKNLYMILEYLSGGELFSYLRISQNFSSQVVKFYAAEVILALEYLHSLYIAYRDLKPENLMLTEDGHVKLTDLGFAKKIHNKSYTFCGTSEYLAPEVIQRKGHNHTVDYWALGVLIFELMSGRTPFDGQNEDDILESILASNDQIKFPPKTFSQNAKELICGLLTINVNNRLGKKSVQEIKQHKWFENCDWQAVYEKAIRPPLIPTIYFEGDTGNFDSYEETEEQQFAQQRELDLFDEW